MIQQLQSDNDTNRMSLFRNLNIFINISRKISMLHLHYTYFYLLLYIVSPCLCLDLTCGIAFNAHRLKGSVQTTTESNTYTCA